MRLALPYLFLYLYLLASLVLPLPCRFSGKAALGLVLLAVSLKYLIYEHAGGNLLMPDLPRPFLLLMETLFAALLVLIFIVAVRDLLSLLIRLSHLLGSGWRLPPASMRTLAGMLGVSLGLGVFGVWQSLQVPNVRTVEIPVPGLAAELDGFSIVQLSDLHIGPLLKADWAAAVVERSNALDADLVVLTGDMVDGHPDALQKDVAPLAGLRARHGVYGILGNHEYYSGEARWLPHFAELGLTMLHNETRMIAGPAGIALIGLCDHAARRFGLEGPDLRKALGKALGKAPASTDDPDRTDGTEGGTDGGTDGASFGLLLAHQPRDAESNAAACPFGMLQLSGHTHGGMVFFLKPLIAAFNNNFVNGLYPLAKGKTLYVNPGTGLWNGFSCRLGVPAEITRLVLRRQEP